MGDAYYNENDEFAAAWLKNLSDAGLIARGEVDTRSIVDVRPADIAGFDQCHFFAGIGVWSHALRLAGWADDRHVWTGSCPCGPFSGAGLKLGFDDERHLWPEFFRLIRECRPRIILGEQVASPNGLAWFDLVQSDLEDEDYASAAIDLCAAGIGAPHIRQRLYWVAHAAGDGLQRGRPGQEGSGRDTPRVELERLRDARLLVDGERARLEGYGGDGDGSAGWPFADRSIAEAGSTGELADADGGYASAERLQRGGQQRQFTQDGGTVALAHAAGRQLPIEVGRSQGRDGNGPDRPNAPAGPVNGIWRDADWLLCRDGKWRAVEPGTFPLAHGVASRVGRLRGYGNAIVAPLAQAFIEAVMETMP